MKTLEQELQTSFKNDFLKTRLNIHFTHNFLGNITQDLFKKYGLSPTQFNVLRILRGQHPKMANIGLIKERLIDRSSDVSRIVDRLVAKDLIHRSECPNDRRQKDVMISDKGLDLLSKMDSCEQQLDAKLQHLTPTELSQLNLILDKLRNQ
ncbi:MAG: MarR family transcriptional regulator [Flavobacteriales bacterium CG_4_8_14_3_um_filter_35_10]|nr:MarR family transcriptional regulator [Zetaproteobacteria bacterium]NDK18216.1 MarR family transcriptional regulator [Flavobacteriales bacterium]OIO13356.1 MAG: MarR family transcriptional regulator [Flavobacteriaceae bacterium CG1_02_35_72]PIR14504.1 MAG: MarR family transcriptional regulator [Flavobacteriales bacterium CG11_big_fil_rev_8_21_14_0_20_35_7]PIX06734.1 MAG: MarR family transcriptional regulator [Flavobacteriales bacterium CG_4_8_14_3_um_filter_35_10]PJA06844.1 MAG: MarR family